MAFRPLRRVKFLITAPFIVLGGLAAFGAYLFNRNRQG